MRKSAGCSIWGSKLGEGYSFTCTQPILNFHFICVKSTALKSHQNIFFSCVLEEICSWTIYVSFRYSQVIMNSGEHDLIPCLNMLLKPGIEPVTLTPCSSRSSPFASSLPPSQVVPISKRWDTRSAEMRGGVNPFQSVRTNYGATHSDSVSQGKGREPLSTFFLPLSSLRLRFTAWVDSLESSQWLESDFLTHLLSKGSSWGLLYKNRSSPTVNE